MEYTDVLINIRKILRSINLESKKVQKEHGISIPQYLCLNFLSRQENYKTTAKQLRIHLNLNASTITGILSRLESKGFIAKLPNEVDKRSTFIYLTALGMDKEKSIPSLLHEKLSQKLSRLPDNALSELQSSLELIVEFMEVEDMDAAPLLTPDSTINAENGRLE